MEKKKTNGNRNRIAGHNLERDTVAMFKDAGFPNVMTSRACNRVRDAEGIDLAHADEIKFGRFPYNVQCKNYCSGLKYWDLLENMARVTNVINVVIHKFTKKKTDKSGNTAFHPVGRYAILPLEDFVTLVKAAENHKAMTLLIEKEI
jgi:hypothetical protein